MRTMAKVGGLACLAVLLHGASAFAGDEALLNGRYSFVMHGTGGPGQSEQFARVGTLVFDGNGNVTAMDILQVRNGFWGGIPPFPLPIFDTTAFASGTYSIENNGLGQITFSAGYASGSVTVSEQDEVWDIALTENGKGFDIRVRKSRSFEINILPGGDDGFFNERLTLSGQAKAN